MERDLTRRVAPYLSPHLIWQAAGDPLPLFVSDHRGLSTPHDLSYLEPFRTPHLARKREDNSVVGTTHRGAPPGHRVAGSAPH